MAESKGLSVSPIDEDDTTGAAGPAEPSEPEAPEVTPEAEAPEPAGYRLRRAPRYRAFGFTGVLVGVLLGAVLALSFEATSTYSERTILGYFVAIFGLLGALFGCGLAVLLDRRKG
ncbi:hypothetical protein LWF15_01785 [Kineosporia rhizophila]|uniref:hypothetical protein n=1 Tax=Kineosporia TaxID=49184 RepID=UPI001E380C73|nr:MULTISPECIES: hypothetical protein [Kineosporia]MCE0534230.1 hypothetical protein [Kineosporia rhizophila]GLY13778.1 hypothetical protein Kisp01_07940 [Kineosporia sp. NBRC 101677]